MREINHLLASLFVNLFFSLSTHLIPRWVFLRDTVDLNVTEAGCIDDTTQTGGVATGAITRRSHYHDECEGKESMRTIKGAVRSRKNLPKSKVSDLFFLNWPFI